VTAPTHLGRGCRDGQEANKRRNGKQATHAYIIRARLFKRSGSTGPQERTVYLFFLPVGFALPGLAADFFAGWSGGLLACLLALSATLGAE
jgi:hypothetical protein